MCVLTHLEGWLNCQAKRNFVLDSKVKPFLAEPKDDITWRYRIKIWKFLGYRMQIKKRCPIFSTFNSFLPSRSWAADIKLNLVSQTVHFVKEILALVFITIDFESFSPYWSIFKHRETSWNIAPSCDFCWEFEKIRLHADHATHGKHPKLGESRASQVFRPLFYFSPASERLFAVKRRGVSRSERERETPKGVLIIITATCDYNCAI